MPEAGQRKQTTEEALAVKDDVPVSAKHPRLKAAGTDLHTSALAPMLMMEASSLAVSQSWVTERATPRGTAMAFLSPACMATSRLQFGRRRA
ncbi:unnamed protein product [Ixodes pacificus]